MLGVKIREFCLPPHKKLLQENVNSISCIDHTIRYHSPGRCMPMCIYIYMYICTVHIQYIHVYHSNFRMPCSTPKTTLKWSSKINSKLEKKFESSRCHKVVPHSSYDWTEEDKGSCQGFFRRHPGPTESSEFGAPPENSNSWRPDEIS